MSASPSPTPAEKLPIWPVLIATTATQSFTTLCSMSMSAIAPDAAQGLGLPVSLVGYQVGIVYVGAMLSSLVGGAMVHRFGPARSSQIALWMAAFGCITSALFGLPGVLLGAVVIGLGYGFTNPSASMLISRAATGGRTNLIFSIKQCGVPFGGMLAGLLLPPITLLFDWRAALLTCALICLLWSLALHFYRARWDDQRQPGAPIFADPLEGVRLIWNHRILRWLAWASLAYTAVQLSLTGFLVTYLVAEIGMTLVVAGGVLAVVQICGAVGRLSWGWAADWLQSGLRAMILNGVIAIPASFAVAAIAPDWPMLAVWLAAGLFGFCAVGWNGVFMAVIARQAPPGTIGHATSGVLFLTFAGVLAGPSALSLLHEQADISYAAGYMLMAGVTFIGILCLIAARPSVLRRARPS